MDRIFTQIFKAISSPVYAAPPQLFELLNKFDEMVELIFPLGAIIAVGVFVLGGYMWMTASGDPSRIKMAQGVLTWGVIGFIFLFLIKSLLLAMLKFIT